MSEWNYKIFWDEVVKQFKEDLPVSTFSLYFPVASYASSRENTIVITVPSNFIKMQIMQKYKVEIEHKLLELSGRNLNIEFTVQERTVEKPSTDEDSDTDKNGEEQTAVAAPKKKPSLKNTELRSQHPDLNPDYNFEDFVIGPNNNFAANAAIAITKNPGTAYNPFLIYGGVGLGKTHIMQAIGNNIWKTTKLKVIYVTAEKFTNEFIEHINKKTMPAFKSKYRSADVLLIDDIHFFQGKTETQEELFHTFNELYERNKQIVFTCDRPPSELKNLSQRLQSRFERGLSVDLQTPGYEIRCAILFKKLEKHTVTVNNEIIELIAKNVSSNIRDLEAALTKLIAYSEITKKEITEQTARDLLKDFFGSTRQRNVSVDIIQKTVANYYNISVADIKSKKRTKSFAQPRHIAMYLCREMTECSTTELGNEFGGRDHTTILHGCSKIEELTTADPSKEREIYELRNLIKENTNK